MGCEEYLDAIARCINKAGFPAMPSEWLSAIRDAIDEIWVVLGRDYRTKFFQSPLGDDISAKTISMVEELTGAHAYNPRRFGFEYLGTKFWYITCDSNESTFPLHGMIIKWEGGYEIFGDERTIRSEAALVEADWLIHNMTLLVCTRRDIVLSGLLTAFGSDTAYVGHEEWFSDHGLRKHRLDKAMAAMKAWACLRGLFRHPDRTVSMVIPQKGIPKRNQQLAESSSLGRCFEEVVFDRALTPETATEIDRCFNQLLDSGVIPAAPRSFHAGVHFRRFTGIKDPHTGEYNAWYSPSLRTIFLKTVSPGNFIHEYGHLIDHLMGHPSNNFGFNDLYQTYAREVTSAAGEVQVKPYYLDRGEAFSRCLEIYVKSAAGESILLSSKDWHYAYPESQLLVSMASDYFERLFGHRRDS